jgi:glycyl-tRNA synthetase (class II)
MTLFRAAAFCDHLELRFSDWCSVTVDFKTLEDQTVTVRDRDSMKQERTPTADLPASLAPRLR